MAGPLTPAPQEAIFDPSQNQGATPLPQQQAGPLTPSYGTMDPSMMANQAIAQSGIVPPTNPYAASQHQQAQDLEGFGGGPLAQMNTLKQNRDADGQDKMAAMDKAMGLFNAVQSGQTTNLPMMEAAAGLLSPTPNGGGFAASLGQGLSRAAPAVQQQRQMDMANASRIANLGIEKASVPMEMNQADNNDFNNRMRLANQAETSATNAQGRSDSAYIAGQSRLGSAAIQAGGRTAVAQINVDGKDQVANINYASKIDAATIAANKNRWKSIGTDANGNAVVQDMNAPGDAGPVFYQGPQVTLTGSQSQGVMSFDNRKAQWLALHPGDDQNALLFAGGQKQMSPADALKTGYTIAGQTMFGATPDVIDGAAKRIAGQLSGAGKAPAAAPGTAPPAANPGTSQPAAKPSAAPAQLRPPTPAELDMARQSVQRKGAAAVKQRMTEQGIDPSGL